MFFKKFSVLFFALTICLSVFAYAKTYYEDVFNENTVIEQELAKKDSLNVSVEIINDGTLTINLTELESDEVVNPRLDFSLQKDGEVLSSYSTKGQGTFSPDKYVIIEGLKEGEYNFVINNPSEFATVRFKFEFDLRKYNYAEAEPNDSTVSATPIEFGKAYIGGVFGEQERDLYSFEMKENGYVFLGFNCFDEKYFEIFDENMQSIEVFTYETNQDKTVDTSFSQRVCLPKGKYYLSITNGGHMLYPKYTFELTAGYADIFETESNNSHESADNVIFGKEYTANISSVSDKDYYKFSLNQKDNVEIDFYDSVTSKTKHYSIEILNSDFEVIKSINECSTQKINVELDKGTYYFHIFCPSKKAFSGASYRFTVSVALNHDNIGEQGTPSVPVPDDNSDYTSCVFTDISTDAWYYNYVCTANSYGLIDGIADNIFAPLKNLTLAEAITIAARLHGFESKDTSYLQNWYDSYIDYATENHIINPDDFDDYTKPATRAQMAYIFSNVISDDHKQQVKEVVIPDVTPDTKYSDSIYLLYSLGVLEGHDDNGNFAPHDYITRAEVSAIITRIYKFK